MLKRLVNRIIEMQEKRAAYWMLQNLSNRELRDIGIGRADIRRMVYDDEWYILGVRKRDFLIIPRFSDLSTPKLGGR